MSPKPENESSSNSSQSESVSVDLTLENSAVDESLSVDSGKAQKRNHSNTSEDIDNKKLLAITLVMKAYLNTTCYCVYETSVKYCCLVLH